MGKKYIHVNQHVIELTKKNNENNPVITIKEGKNNIYCHEVEILGKSKVSYSGYCFVLWGKSCNRNLGRFNN